jgi:lipoate-protein ligase A
MKLLDLVLATPAENLALDEALLEDAEASNEPGEVLRLWESPQPLVVVGRSSRVDVEVNEAECRRRAVPVLRRCSGGAAVVTGPGCLMYAVVLSYGRRPNLHLVSEAHCFVMTTMMAALRRITPAVEFRGTSDLTLDGKKFSGNSLRAKRTHLLYHGTLLFDLPLELISACLRTPPRQPDYRQGRSHEEFLVNLGASADALRQALVEGWNAQERLAEWPHRTTQRLVDERYSRRDWNYRR